MNRSKTQMARGGLLLVSIFSLLLLSGCFGVDSQFRHIRDTVLLGTHAEYEVESEFGVGRFILGIARRIVNAAAGEDPDAAVAAAVLREIRGVEIGTYRLRNFEMNRSQVHRRTMDLVLHLQTQGFDSIVRDYHDNGASMVLVQQHPTRPGRIRELLVLEFDASEMNLVRLKGDVGEIIDIAVRDEGFMEIDGVIEDSMEQ